MSREIELYDIEPTLESLYQNLTRLQQDYDAHNHDGSSSRSFETLIAQTVVGQTMLIKKTSYEDTQDGFWIGFDDGVFKMNLGNSTSSLKWNGTSLDITGSITATSGTIGGFTITATALQTAASGARAVISSTDKSFYVYDAVGQVARIGIDGGFAITITPTSSTTGGIIISSAEAGNGYYYSNSTNVASRGLFVEQSSSGASNSLPCIEARHAGAYYAIFAKGTNSSGGMIVEVAGGKGIYLLNSGATPAIDIVDSSTTGSGPSIALSYSRQGAAMDITASASSGNLTGIKMSINNSGGNEYAFEFAGAEVVSSAVGGSQNKKVRVIVGGAVYYIPLNDA